MKKTKKISLFALGLFLLCSAAIMSQPQSEMSSTSAMLQNDKMLYNTRNAEAVMSTGSAYSAEVGAPEASTPAKAPSGPHRTPVNPLDPHLTPLGDAAWPLALLALAYAINKVRKRVRA